MDKNPLRVWLFSTGKIVKNTDNRNVTHYMLDGGKLDLTADYQLFQELYAKYINFKNCIVEKKTDVFRFFIDFDILSTEILDINTYAVSVQNVMYNVYNKCEMKCIITKADNPKEIKKGDDVFIKQGYHFNWPDITVDKIVALRIRENILISLNTIYGKPETFFDSWDKIIDKCVYDKNGLRLVGSDKCTYSDGKYTYENRVYNYYATYIGNKLSEEHDNTYKCNLLKVIQDTSIRTDTQEITEFHDLPEYEETEEDFESDNSGNFTLLSNENSQKSSILRFFKNHVTGYRVEDIRGILKSNMYDTLYLINTKSKYCQNKCGYHTNNHIYFKLTPAGICQMCMSENDGEPDDNGNVINCKNFESGRIPLSHDLMSSLKWGVKQDSTREGENVSLVSLMMDKISDNLSNKKAIVGPKTRKKK
tara:strand:+ start:1745 stop:3007 length:1263 start_codon:yes stop_codon:yes gene_type:complete